VASKEVTLDACGDRSHGYGTESFCFGILNGDQQAEPARKKKRPVSPETDERRRKIEGSEEGGDEMQAITSQRR